MAEAGFKYTHFEASAVPNIPHYVGVTRSDLGVTVLEFPSHTVALGKSLHL